MTEVVTVEHYEGPLEVLDQAFVLDPPGTQLQEEGAVICGEGEEERGGKVRDNDSVIAGRLHMDELAHPHNELASSLPPLPFPSPDMECSMPRRTCLWT